MYKLVVSVALLFAIIAAVHASVYTVSNSTDLWAAFSKLKPGDELKIRGGNYTTKVGRSFYRLITLRGTRTAPIRVHGAANEVVVIEGDKAQSQNILNLDVEHVSFSNIKFVYGSRGLRIQHGLHSLFENIVITKAGATAFSANDAGQTYQNLTMRRMEIFDILGGTGECFYLGCNNAACKIINSVVEQNYCHDMMKTTHGSFEVKTGSYGNIIRDNVIHDTPYPSILMYSTYFTDSAKAEAAGKPNIVEGNIVWNTKDNGIQATGNCIIRNNIVFGFTYGGITAQANQGIVENVVISHNTVIGAGSSYGLYLSNAPGLVVTNNALYCPTGIKAPKGLHPSISVLRNIILKGTTGLPAPNATLAIGDMKSDFLNVKTIPYNVYPSANSAVLGKAISSNLKYDFNYKPRPVAAGDIGAYQHTSSATNPGWNPSKSFKTL